MWTLADREKTPRQVAELYAAHHGRELCQGTMGGQWNVGEFAGDFELWHDGRRHAIRYAGGVWTVTPPESEKCG